MIGSPASHAELVAELAGSVALDGAWLPASVRRAFPGLYETAAPLIRAVVLDASGHEDLACLMASGPGGDAVAELDAALAPFALTPFVLLLPSPADPGSAVALARALVAVAPDMRARDLAHRDRGAVLLAPMARLLTARALAGEWSAGPAPGREPDGDTLATLWASAIEDRRSLDALVAQVGEQTIALARARRSLERANAEIERLRASERHEVARLQRLILEERAWVAEQARRIAGSTSWRLGHRLTRLGRRAALRSDRGTNLPAMIARRMDDSDPR